MTAKLEEVIERLAGLRVFLSHTDHLSDRELYTVLWKELLHKQSGFVAMGGHSTWHIDILGSGSEEDNDLYT